MEELDLRPVEWVGDSKERLKEFPKPVQKRIGDALFIVQGGETPPDAKPLKGVGVRCF